MTQIATLDYPNKLIYLHIDTVTQNFSPLLLQQEERALRRSVEANRKFDPMSKFVGNESKGGGNFTPPSTRLRAGVRIVPYDTGGAGEYSLGILDEILNIDDGLADVGVFDRSTVAANVDIDKRFDPVEVRVVTGGSGLDPGQDASLTFIENQLTGIENGWDHDQMMRLVLAALASKMSGPNPGTAGTVSIRDILDGKVRISMPVDDKGYRTGPGVYDPD